MTLDELLKKDHYIRSEIQKVLATAFHPALYEFTLGGVQRRLGMTKEEVQYLEREYAKVYDHRTGTFFNDTYIQGIKYEGDI